MANHCQYPNGRMGDASGVLHLIACDNVASIKIKDRWFCENHAGMVERGCLDNVYTDGTSVRENMEVEDGGE